jgi:hypothetical protein
MFFTLVEVMLHDTMEISGAILPRLLIRRAAGGLVPREERTRDALAADTIRRHVRGHNLLQLRTTVMGYRPTQEVLEDPSVLRFVSGVYRMDLAAERSSGAAARRHLRVLEAARGNVDCLFLHLRDCPALFARPTDAVESVEGESASEEEWTSKWRAIEHVLFLVLLLPLLVFLVLLVEFVVLFLRGFPVIFYG